MESLTKTRKIGEKNGLVSIPINKVKKDFFGAFRGIGPFTKEDELKGQLEE